MTARPCFFFYFLSSLPPSPHLAVSTPSRLSHTNKLPLLVPFTSPLHHLHQSSQLLHSRLSSCCHVLSFSFHLFDISFGIHRRPPALSSLCAPQVDQEADDWDSLEKVRLPLTLNLSQCLLELRQYQQVVQLNSKLLKRHKGNTCECDDGAAEEN